MASDSKSSLPMLATCSAFIMRMVYFPDMYGSGVTGGPNAYMPFTNSYFGTNSVYGMNNQMSQSNAR